MVGPPSEQLNCFCAMQLRKKQRAAEWPPVPLRKSIRAGLPHIRQVHCLQERFNTVSLVQ